MALGLGTGAKFLCWQHLKTEEKQVAGPKGCLGSQPLLDQPGLGGQGQAHLLLMLGLRPARGPRPPRVLQFLPGLTSWAFEGLLGCNVLELMRSHCEQHGVAGWD